MANFELAIPTIITNEGGYTNTEGDTGGETYCGISRNNFPQWTGWAKVDQLSLSHGEFNTSLDLDVRGFYKTQFWNNMHGDAIKSQPLATYILDFYVNAGHNAIKPLQRLLNVTADGIIGPATINALNSYDGGPLLASYHSERLMYYTHIGTGSNARFLQGWLDRANRTYNKLTSQ